MKIDKVPGRVLRVLRILGHTDKAIAAMPARQMFSEYCTWQNVPLSDLLFDLVEQLRDAEKE